MIPNRIPGFILVFFEFMDAWFVTAGSNKLYPMFTFLLNGFSASIRYTSNIVK